MSLCDTELQSSLNGLLLLHCIAVAGKICGDNKDPKTDYTEWPICQTKTNPLYSAGGLLHLGHELRTKPVGGSARRVGAFQHQPLRTTWDTVPILQPPSRPCSSSCRFATVTGRYVCKRSA